MGNSVVKNPPDAALISDLGRSLEMEMATHSNILAQRAPWHIVESQ